MSSLIWGRSLGRLGKQITHFTAQKIYIRGQVAAHSGSPQAEVDVTAWQWECRHGNVDSFYFICEIFPKREIQNSKKVILKVFNCQK
jgi:hypothetical protein